MNAVDALRKVDFNWVVHPDLVWDDAVPSAYSLHGDVCEELIATARTLKPTEHALGRVLLGPAGSGKTHLLSMLRKQAVDNGITFVMTDLTDVRDFFDTLLLGFLLSLQQPGKNGEVQLRSILAHVIDYLGTPDDGAEYASGLSKCRPERLAEPVDAILGYLQRKQREKTNRYRDVLRAMVLLNSENYEVNSIGQTWLQGMEIDDSAKSRYRFSAASRPAPEIVQGLAWLASLRGPLIVAIDQFDPIVEYNRQAAEAEAFKDAEETTATAKAILSNLCNGLGSLYASTLRTLPVLTCLETSFETLRNHGLKSNLDRFEPPVSLAPLLAPDAAKAIVQARLDPAYAAAEFKPPYPTYPFKPSFFEEAVGAFPREVLKRCDEHRRRCVRRGKVEELASFGQQPAQVTEPLPLPDRDLDARFDELQKQADVRALLDETREDDVLSRLMVTAATCLVKETPAPEGFEAVVDSDFPGRNSFMPLHARIRLVSDTGAEKHYCMRALEKTHAVAYQARLRAAMTSAGIDRKLDFRHLVIFRTTPPPSGDVTRRRTKEFHDNGGIMVKPEEHEIATLWALQQLASEGHDTFDDWLRERQPVRKLAMMREAKLVKASSGEAPQPQATPRPAAPDGGAKPQAPAAPAPATPPPPTPTPPKPVLSEASAAPAPPNAELSVGHRLIGDRQGDAVSIPLRQLKNHVLVVAGSGSGKTVLLKRIIEEAALCGVPAIVVDTANDLAQLSDPWPQPPEGWGAEDAVKARRYFERTETIVWTPGLEGGNPMRLEPLPDLAAVANDEDELNEAVSMAREALQGVVAKRGGETAHTRLGILTAALRFFANQGGGTLDDFVGLLSDLPQDAGGDISDAAKHASKMADALRSEMQIDPLLGSTGEELDPAVLLGASRGDTTRISVINFAGLSGVEQQQQFLNRLAMALFSWIKRHPADDATPLRGILVVDEARDFIPGVAASACRESFIRLAAQARKYGLGLIFATQAPKDIHNHIVSNCATSFYGKGNSPAVINAIKELLQAKGGRGDGVARLAMGRFYFHNADVMPAPTKIATSLCLTHHRAPLDRETIIARAQVSRGAT